MQIIIARVTKLAAIILSDVDTNEAKNILNIDGMKIGKNNHELT
jgi:hypothetical protein